VQPTGFTTAAASPLASAPAVLELAEGSRWRAPEVTAALAEHAARVARDGGDQATALLAEGWLLQGAAAIGRGVAAVPRAVAALSDAAAGNHLAAVDRLRVALAGVARSLDDRSTCLVLLAPVLDRADSSPRLSADAHLEAALCQDARAGTGGRSPVDTALAALRQVGGEYGELGLAAVDAALAGQQRAMRQLDGSVEYARAGLRRILGERQQSGALPPVSPYLAATLGLELTLALLDQGRRDDATEVARTVLRWGGQPGSLVPTARLRLAMAQRVYLPSGEREEALAAAEWVSLAVDQRDLPELEVESYSLLAELRESGGELSGALDASRRAHAAYRALASTVERALVLLVRSAGEAPTVQRDVAGREPSAKPNVANQTDPVGWAATGLESDAANGAPTPRMTGAGQVWQPSVQPGRHPGSVAPRRPSSESPVRAQREGTVRSEQNVFQLFEGEGARRPGQQAPPALREPPHPSEPAGSAQASGAFGRNTDYASPRSPSSEVDQRSSLSSTDPLLGRTLGHGAPAEGLNETTSPDVLTQPGLSSPLASGAPGPDPLTRTAGSGAADRSSQQPGTSSLSRSSGLPKAGSPAGLGLLLGAGSSFGTGVPANRRGLTEADPGNRWGRAQADPPPGSGVSGGGELGDLLTGSGAAAGRDDSPIRRDPFGGHDPGAADDLSARDRRSAAADPLNGSAYRTGPDLLGGSDPLTGRDALSGSDPLTGRDAWSGSGPVAGRDALSGWDPLGSTGDPPRYGSSPSGDALTGSGPLIGSGSPAGADPLTGSGSPPGADPWTVGDPLTGSSPLAGLGSFEGSDPLTGTYSLAGADALAGVGAPEALPPPGGLSVAELAVEMLGLMGIGDQPLHLVLIDIATPDGSATGPAVGELARVIASRVAEQLPGHGRLYLLNHYAVAVALPGADPQTVTRWVRTVSNGLSQRWTELSAELPRAAFRIDVRLLDGDRTVAEQLWDLRLGDGGSGVAGPDVHRADTEEPDPLSGRHIAGRAEPDPLGADPSANRISALPGSGGRRRRPDVETGSTDTPIGPGEWNPGYGARWNGASNGRLTSWDRDEPLPATERGAHSNETGLGGPFGSNGLGKHGPVPGEPSSGSGHSAHRGHRGAPYRGGPGGPGAPDGFGGSGGMNGPGGSAAPNGSGGSAGPYGSGGPVGMNGSGGSAGPYGSGGPAGMNGLGGPGGMNGFGGPLGGNGAAAPGSGGMTGPSGRGGTGTGTGLGGPVNGRTPIDSAGGPDAASTGSPWASATATAAIGAAVVAGAPVNRRLAVVEPLPTQTRPKGADPALRRVATPPGRVASSPGGADPALRRFASPPGRAATPPGGADPTRRRATSPPEGAGPAPRSTPTRPDGGSSRAAADACVPVNGKPASHPYAGAAKVPVDQQRPASDVARNTPAGTDAHAGRHGARHHLKAAEASAPEPGPGPAPAPPKPMSELSFAELLAGALDAYRES